MPLSTASAASVSARFPKSSRICPCVKGLSRHLVILISPSLVAASPISSWVVHSTIWEVCDSGSKSV